MIQVNNASPVPNTILGTGTAQQNYASKLNLPGSGRLDGIENVVRISGVLSPTVNTNVQLTVFGNYPSAQVANSVANITSAAMLSNVATYNANNAFTVGQYVTVANIANNTMSGLVGPLISANSTAFTANIINGAVLAVANIVNAAQTNASAQLGPIPVYVAVASPTLLTNTPTPFEATLDMWGDQTSGVLAFSGSDKTVNFNTTGWQTNISTPTGLFNGTIAFASSGLSSMPNVNFKQEPPAYLTVSHAWGTSNANNSATIKSFYLED